MGATPYSDEEGSGVTFRAWAPFASKVHVAGTFNSWSKIDDPLHSEGNGYWSADIPAAQVGHEYKFVMNSGEENETWRVDTYVREVRHSNGDGVIAPHTPFQELVNYSTPPWNELVIYELHVGTFNEDPHGPDHRGTFRSIIPKLPYLKDLGINAIQLLPANEFAMDISLGYNPAHLFAIETSYGGPNGLREFVEAAHHDGLAVIFDVVYNHWGPSDIEHSVWRFDGWNKDDFGGIYFFNDGRADTKQWGAKNRPDYGRREVRQFIRDNALRWLEERHCDGLRWDATNYIRNIEGSNWNTGANIPEGWSLMQDINREIQSRQPWKICIAEDMQNNDWITLGTDKGGAGFNSQWSSYFVHTIRSVICGEEDASRDLEAVANAIRQVFNGDAFHRVIFTESHDEVMNGKCRMPEQIWPGNADSYWSRKRSTLGASLVFTAPGIPMIFQGQEFLEDRWFDDHRMLDWSKLTRPHIESITLLYRDFIRLRRNWYDNTRGLRGHGINVHHVNNSDKVIAFHRWDRGGPRDDVVIVANFGNRGYASYTIGFPRGGRWQVRLNSDARCYGPDFSDWPSNHTEAFATGCDGMPCRGNIGIGPYSTIILSQDH
jgi:1,4-alpha-glucan branching enzyme